MIFTISIVKICIFGLALYVGYFIFLKKKRDPRFPPGPSSLPIIGNVLQLGTQPQKVFLKWAEKYGNVFSFKMGTLDVIMLNDAKTIKDVFAEACSAGRSPNPIMKSLSNGNYGIAIGEGEHWEQQRRFTLRTLRDLGFAKTSMEGIILEEINALCKFLEERTNISVTGDRLFNAPVVNVLWNLVSGERHDWEGSESPKILKCANDLMEALQKILETGLFYAPVLRYIAPDLSGWNFWLKVVSNLNNVCQETIEKHAQNLDPDSPKDLIDYYLVEMQKNADPSSSFYKETGNKNLNAVILDLFLAGSETTSHTLSWLMIHLSNHQQVLTKVQAEIDNVIGPGRQPSTTDRPNTPYTEATINEILRRTSVVNNGIPHRMLQDTDINGYFFPKNATVISNIFSAHNDPKVWGDPENFRPERFLSEDGTTFLKNENLIPFSAGRRICPGESLARDTLYLFLTCICQKFDIKSGSAKNLEAIKNVEPKNKLLNEPNSYEIIVSLRQK